MKFVFGVAVGYFLFHPLNENNKFDRAVLEALQKGRDKLLRKVEEVFAK